MSGLESPHGNLKLVYSDGQPIRSRRAQIPPAIREDASHSTMPQSDKPNDVDKIDYKLFTSEHFDKAALVTWVLAICISVDMVDVGVRIADAIFQLIH